MKQVKDFFQFLAWVLLFSIVVVFVNHASAQNTNTRKQGILIDTVKTDTVKTDDHDKHLILTSLSIASANFWRGNVYGNQAPMLSGTLAIHTKNHFEVGATATSPVNGSRDGFGRWMELYVSKTYKRFTFTIDDYYFFNAKDSLNDYFNWDRKVTQHLVEGRVKYSSDRISVTGSYVLYAASSSVNTLYLESEYFLVPKLFSVTVGGLFGQSALNFYDKGGLTVFGFTGYRDIKITNDFTLPFHFCIMSSPNYKNASKYPAFTQNPINFIVGFTI